MSWKEANNCYDVCLKKLTILVFLQLSLAVIEIKQSLFLE